MPHSLKKLSGLAFLVSYLMAFSSWAQTATEERVAITSITPSLNTGQDYSPWLDDNLNNMVQSYWMPLNFQYIDVKLTLAKTTTLSRLSLFDYQGIFTDKPATIYAQYGTQRTLLGTFDGSQYNVYVDLAVSGTVLADAIIVNKYCNNIPMKIKVFGKAGTTTTPATPATATLTFAALPTKTVGSAPFALSATSTNTATPITYTSSNASVVSVAATTGGTWQATVVGAGTATITASQVASSAYTAASATQAITVQAALPVQVAPVLAFTAIATKKVGDAPFTLVAVSTNLLTPVTYASSNPGVVSVAATTGGTWQATVVGAGTATITASQAATSLYLAAAVSQPVTVQAATTTTPAPTAKLPIDASRWYQLTNAPNTISPLFDGSVTTGTTIGWGKIISTYDSYYALLPGESMSLESIKLYDGDGTNPNDPMTLSVITDTWQRIPVATFTGGLNGQWVGPNPNQPGVYKLSTPISNVRYLVITASWAYPTEIELYGTYVAGTPLATYNAQAQAIAKQIKLKQEMGVNAFEWDLEDPNSPGQVDEARLKAVKNFTGIRHYLDWQKLESTEGGYTYNPVHSGGWNYDIMYQRCKAEGIEVLACIKTLPDWLLNTYPGSDRESENVPVRYGKDFSDPNSYLEQAKLGFQYAARYGYNTGVPANLLSVDQSTRWAGDGVNQVKIGLGYIKYMECDNERDKWWKGRKAYQTGREYAANLSAFYDGNKNTMGAGVGVKNADPTMQVVMGGLANPSVDYVRGMIDWCKQYRGYKADGTVNLCWDVINYHLYSNDASSSQGGNATRGAAPEVSSAGQVAQDFMKLAHQYANDMPVWITETGYDTNQGSPLKAIAIGNKTVLQTQADWTLRTALLYARWGVERTFLYQLADENPSSSTQFASMGLINSDHTPKLAASYLQQVNALMGNYTYTGTLSSDPIVDRYEKDGTKIYALVVPDEKARTATYTLDLGSATTATIYQPQAGQTSLAATAVNTVNGKVTITVTETPQFVVAGGVPATTPTPATCAGTGSIGWEQWTNVRGQSLNAIPTQKTPDNTATLTKFETSYSQGDWYGDRIRGYLCVPQTGNYVFQIAGDDDCQLWLSTDDSEANKVSIASVAGWTNQGEWSKYASQRSVSIALVAGRRYYVEVLHRDGDGGDFVSVGWTLPDGSVEAPIAGSHLIPYTTQNIAKATASAARGTATTAQVSGDDATAAALLDHAELSVYPNPSAGQTSVEFSLPAAGQATLAIYDEQGRLVKQLYSGSAEAGIRSHFEVPGASLASGFYLVKLITSSQVLTQKLVRVQ
ncbi:MAG: T9SS type A sorting domain-containing protein [Hymenobacter sp.]|nr:MAG: T9SS type A sorting domain-containing protein [Hymenobacter sp.]